MRINIYTGEGVLQLNRTSKGGTVLDYITLVSDPTVDADAATKRYVDGRFDNMSASLITLGEIQTTTLPAVTGDLTSALGTNLLTLTPVVSSGVYTKMNVTQKGLVVGGGSLVAADIPNLSWAVFTTDLPTTPEGYGIRDAISTTGGDINVNITLNGAPTLAAHAATKAYTDTASLSAGGGGLSVGDIMLKLTTTTPTGFLRCNGATVATATYPALFAVVGGSTFVPTAINSGGKPWKNQYDFNTQQTGAITGWGTATALPVTVTESQAIVTNGRAFLLGGWNSNAQSATVYTAIINADGTLGTWTTSTALPAAVHMSQAIVTSSRVFLLGGYTSGTHSSTVYTAPINTDGTLGAWTTAGSLPGTVFNSQAVITANRVFLLGGEINGVRSSTVYTAPVNADGTLGTWATSTSLPAAVYFAQAVVTNRRVFLLGGLVAGGNVSTVYTAPINADGTLGSWTTSTSLPVAIQGAQAVVTASRIYLLGGNGLNGAVYTAPINTDGTLGTWDTSTALPDAVQGSNVIITNSRVLLLGGYIGVNPSSTVFIAPFLGGLNSYTNYTAVSPAAPANFTLPNIAAAPFGSGDYFIKF